MEESRMNPNESVVRRVAAALCDAQGNGSFASVRIPDCPFSADRDYTYRIPERFCGEVSRGTFVTVPFGRGNQPRIALVTGISDKTALDASSVKDILSVCSDGVKLDGAMTDLCLWMHDQVLCTVGDAVRVMVPAFALSELVDRYSSARPYRGKDELLAAVCGAVETLGEVTAEKLAAKEELFPFPVTAGEISLVCRKLARDGYLTVKTELSDGHSVKTARLYRLRVDTATAAALASGEKAPEYPKLRSKAHKKVLSLFDSADTEFSEEELIAATGATRPQLKSLVDRGLLFEMTEETFRDVIRVKGNGTRTPLTLSEEQGEAFSVLSSLLHSGKPQAALLHGVTGSGKTAVMTALLDDVLEGGGGAILLLPEISLTPQTLSIFCTRYGERVAVIHSGLSAGERFDAYRRIKEGIATLVIGTRSAVFSPVQNLKLIIMDEEQEHTYKSDRDPKYHARDVARFRCAKEGSMLLLASATPSFESYKKACDGVYTLVRMTHRYGDAVLPEVVIADMRREPSGAAVTPIGNRLLTELFRVTKQKEQAILYLNRRGYNRYLSCRSCGKPVLCSNCSVAMTYHTAEGRFDTGELVCHLCGVHRPAPTVCPDCASPHLSYVGFGTQRVEKDLQDLFPRAHVLRMDTDTTSVKDSYETLLGAFRRHEGDILLGTQMVTKGHDFPAVTLVGVLSADSSMFAGDFRAAERTFSSLTQVIGRAGRADKPGLAVIQTENPDAEVIRYAATQDYEAFYNAEIRLRKDLVFPPFCDMVLMTLTGENEKELLLAASGVRELLDRMMRDTYSDVKAAVFGPFEAPVYRVDNKFRLRIVLKCILNRRSRTMFAELLASPIARGESASVDFSAVKGRRAPVKVRRATYHLSIDFNPTSL